MIKKEPSKQELKSIATKKIICDSALKLFKEYGYENTTIADICKESGFTSGAVYHHFKSKKEIINTIYDTSQRSNKKIELNEETLRYPMKAILDYVLDATRNWTILGYDLCKHLEVGVGIRHLHHTSIITDINPHMQTLMSFIAVAQENGTFDDSISALEAASYMYIAGTGLLVEWCESQGGFDLLMEMEKYMSRILRAFQPKIK